MKYLFIILIMLTGCRKADTSDFITPDDCPYNDVGVMKTELLGSWDVLNPLGENEIWVIGRLGWFTVNGDLFSLDQMTYLSPCRVDFREKNAFGRFFDWTGDTFTLVMEWQYPISRSDVYEFTKRS